MSRRRLVRPAVIVGSTFLGAQIGLGIYLGEGALRRPRAEPERTAAQQQRSLPPALGATVTDVAIRSADGASLVAWLWRPAVSAGPAVVILHGIGDNRNNWDEVAAMFLAHGYLVLTPDSRGHGSSGGDLVTYGLREKDDLAGWARWLTAEQAARGVVAFGASMGAATALLAAGDGAPLCAVAAEGTFASFREIAMDRVGGGLGRVVLRPVVETGIAWAHFRFGVDVGAIDVASAVARARVPILLVHGDRDTENPPRHSYLIKQRAPGCELWIVPGAVHCGAYGTDPAGFEQRLTTFFARALPGCR